MRIQVPAKCFGLEPPGSCRFGSSPHRDDCLIVDNGVTLIKFSRQALGTANGLNNPYRRGLQRLNRTLPPREFR
jgi:hypothetical protein